MNVETYFFILFFFFNNNVLYALIMKFPEHSAAILKLSPPQPSTHWSYTPASAFHRASSNSRPRAK